MDCVAIYPTLPRFDPTTSGTMTSDNVKYGYMQGIKVGMILLLWFAMDAGTAVVILSLHTYSAVGANIEAAHLGA